MRKSGSPRNVIWSANVMNYIMLGERDERTPFYFALLSQDRSPTEADQTIAARQPAEPSIVARAATSVSAKVLSRREWRVASAGPAATTSSDAARRARIARIGLLASQGKPSRDCWQATTTSRVSTQACRPSRSIPVELPPQ